MILRGQGGCPCTGATSAILVSCFLCGSEMPCHKIKCVQMLLAEQEGRIMSMGWKNVGLLLTFGIRLGVSGGEHPFFLTLRLGTAVKSRVN